MADIAEAIFVYALLTAFAGTVLAAVYGHYCMGWSDPAAPGYKPRVKRPPPESAEDVMARLKARAEKYEYLRQLGQAGEAYGDLKMSAKNYKKMQEGGQSSSLGTLTIKHHRARIAPDGLGAHGGAEITTTTTVRLDPFSLSTRKVVTTRVVGASPGRGGGGGRGGGAPGTFGSLSRPNTPLLLLDGGGGGGGGGGGSSLFREPSPSLQRSSSLPLHATPGGGLRLPALQHNPNSQPGNGAGPYPSPAEFKLHGRLDQLESLLGRVAERLELDPGAAPRFSSSSSAAAPSPMEGGGGGGGGGISLGSMERFVAEESEGFAEQVDVGGGGGGYGLSAFRAAAHLSTAENNQNSPTESMADGLSPAAQRDKPSPAEELANLMARCRDRQELARSRSSSGSSFNMDRGGGQQQQQQQQQRLVGRGKKVSPYGA